MEEEDQEVIKHVCKFCNKNFPCGRSLGGHMRSHVINVVSAETTEKFVKFSSSSLNNEEAAVGYGLRENPKKTWRLTDSSEDHKDTNLVVVLCKECGKGFQSLKALFGHMKCHSDKERVSKNDNSLDDDQDSWNSQKVDMDSQSDTEATVPKRKRRSKRRRTRYMMTPVTSSSVSFVTANFAPSSSSVSEAELEQEEVALSLMMLSRDVGNWGGFNFVAESSDKNSSLHLEAPLADLVADKIEGKRVISNCSEMAKLAKPRDKKFEFGNSGSSILKSKGKSSELLATESPGIDGFRNRCIENGKVKKPELDSESAFEVNGEELVKSKSNNKYTSMKAKFFDSEQKSSSSMRNLVNKSSGGESSKKSNKRGKFECATCKKIFHSYQALGGHRASHKRNKGCCFASRNESSENTNEVDAEPRTESELMKNTDINEYVEEDHELDAVKTFFDDEKNKEHEVPICLKVFSSGQALGGHKRSHLAGESESSMHSQSQTIVLQESVPEIRNFLDLNLPASTEEESHGHHAEPYRPWWIAESNHKQEAMVGLLSN